MHVDSMLIFIANPIGHGQSIPCSFKEESQDKQLPMLFGSHVRQFLVHYIQKDLLFTL